MPNDVLPIYSYIVHITLTLHIYYIYTNIINIVKLKIVDKIAVLSTGIYTQYEVVLVNYGR